MTQSKPSSPRQPGRSPSRPSGSGLTDATRITMRTAGDAACFDGNVHAASVSRDVSDDIAALRPVLSGGPLSILLDAKGHDRGCVLRFRSGKGLGCSCGGDRTRLDETAVTIGLAIRYALMIEGRRLPMPRGIMAALDELAGHGDPTAIVVWQWLERRGQIGWAASASRPTSGVSAMSSRDGGQSNA